MQFDEPVRLDAVIFGGGASGLWLLDELIAAGHSTLLLEAGELGCGQTVASQGIIHGGLKYSLNGLLNSSARALREMPQRWRRCLAGEESPDLRGARVRADFCYLWRTQRLASRLALLGARRGLRTDTVVLPTEARPPALRGCPGDVARIDEQVVDPGSVLEALAARHPGRILRIDAAAGLEIVTERPGRVTMVRLLDPSSGAPLDLEARRLVLAAGAGNGDLRTRCGLPAALMQRRPLHMVLARGNLPAISGHCVDGMHTRATITSAWDYADRTVWQIGGQIAEDGVRMDGHTLIRHARAELEEILPGVPLDGVEWATYRVDRAEARGHAGRRPAGVHVSTEGNVITIWPTKLALVPVAVDQAFEVFPPPQALSPGSNGILSAETTDAVLPSVVSAWPRPAVAAPPWEENLKWSIAGSDEAA